VDAGLFIHKPDLPPPYVVAVVALDEGPRMTVSLVGKPCRIGDRVRVTWREREGQPALPAFELEDASG
jgi:uncharacterized OB-fold protein